MSTPIGYFQFDTIDGMSTVSTVRKSFWDKHGHLDDRGGHDPKLPSCLDELMESVYEWDESEYDEAQIRAILITAGWEEKQLF